MLNFLFSKSLELVSKGNSIYQVPFVRFTRKRLFASPVNLTCRREITMSSTLLTPKHYERLPKTVIPALYKIQLQPDLEKFTFTGKEEIEVSVKESTNEVIVNAQELEIQEATFKDGSGGVLKGQVTLNEKDEKAFIKFSDKLKTGNGVLSLSFTGTLNDKMKGFYRTKYTTPTGEERYAATTQFEAPDARRAFPCWDEPSFKAKFEVTIIAPKDRTVLSNTEVVKDAPHPNEPNLKIVQFAPSPIMSTYLVAFIVGEYDYVETVTKRNTRIRIYTPTGKKEQGTYALEIASKSLTIFEDFFDIPFPLSKIDHIAIPDFASGAMENWGLVTYRESVILCDPQNTSNVTKEFISIVVCHETAHQWFGNLVTMEWWTDLWLNEGFATFMEYLATDGIFPEFDIWSQFVTQAAMPALQTDSYRNSHPIEVPVNHPDDIDSIFDNISYEKGASVIRMCHNWIGNEAFRKGLKDYLSKHAYGNAVTQDLWDALEAASKKPVGKMMPTWTKQLGYPVLRVSSKQDGNNRILKVEQQKFSVDGSLTDQEKQSTWMIPIDVITSKDPSKVVASTLLTTKSSELIVPGVSESDWIKLNPKVMGFYRVNYSPEMITSLKAGISLKQLEAIDRLQVINDALALNMSGDLKTSYVLSLLDSYANEDNYITWVGIDSCFSKLGSLLSYTDFGDKLNSLGVKVYRKMYEKLGFDAQGGESHTDSLLRSLILSRLVTFKYEPVLKEAQSRFKGHHEGKPIHPDIRSSVYRAVVSSCDDETFNSFFKLYREEKLAEEKNRLLGSIGSTRDLGRIQKVLEFSFSSDVRFQDGWRGIICCVGSKTGREEAWKFFKQNSAEFLKRYGSHNANQRTIETIASGFASEKMAMEIQDFFEKNTFSGTEKVVLRSLESIRSNANWLKREVQDVKDYLNSIR